MFSSATEIEVAAGVFVTTIPNSVAAVRSTLSVPVPKIEISRSRGSRSKRARSNALNLWTLTTISAPSRRPANSSPSAGIVS